jgi:hypothetical protein
MLNNNAFVHQDYWTHPTLHLDFGNRWQNKKYYCLQVTGDWTRNVVYINLVSKGGAH